ncbi:hypothetical protein [Pseudomonas mosselii]|uniref:hypothetical protein n=1 Tax=Pseudomonas mosselii TaxID=78327 RepID=UPI0021D8EEEA|nr:hypothetical protein [Pseudomonas mosselii]MCU9529376.1 hypothetical protein [Pseudomonas mosselii]MCU9536667.1 hypothetical protein [Pseudomonas mosselii]MCU9542288.1 hypothetical protein [Pseudomonas mosselii]MCU9548392.1 hypothetical protein [Pseudomonas mosselii]
MSNTFGQMFTRNPSGGHSACDYDAAVLSFEFNGMAITNPFVDESTIVQVDPTYYGFAEAQIGFIKALRLNLPEGRYMLLTDETGIKLPDMDDVDRNLLKLYDADGNLSAYCFIGHIP